MWYRFTVRFSSLRMRFACLWDECQHLAESLHLGSQASSTLAAVLQPCLHNLHTCSKCFVNPISCAVLQTLSATPLHSWFWLSEWVCCVFINNMLFFFFPPPRKSLLFLYVDAHNSRLLFQRCLKSVTHPCTPGCCSRCHWPGRLLSHFQ